MRRTKFNVREVFVASFEQALQNAGMSGTEDETKPRYWRGNVSTKGMREELFLKYAVTDNIEEVSADNKSVLRTVYINGELYTRSGFGDANFQDLAEAIERACDELKISIVFGDEGTDTSVDQDSPIFYVNFEAEQTILV